jgi:hypothetical protein
VIATVKGEFGFLTPEDDEDSDSGNNQVTRIRQHHDTSATIV